MALSMIVSSTITPLKASASNVENQNNIETIMSQESFKENDENLIKQNNKSIETNPDNPEY